MFNISIHRTGRSKDELAATLLRGHFGGDVKGLAIAERQFPFRVRADLQRAVEQMLGTGERSGGTPGAAGLVRFAGVAQQYMDHMGLDFAAMLVEGHHAPPVVVPPHYDEVDIGEERAVRCLKAGLWLLASDGGRQAVLLSPAVECGQPSGIRFQVATVHDAAGATFAESFFRGMEQAVHDARSYRGKILSLEQGQDYSGRSAGIKVHKLRRVTRDEVILPSRTLDLLDRNVIRFAEQREKLRAAGLSTKKGLLFYGPPGTGKSHTIHYLAAAMAGHTTLLITAEQVGLLSEYMVLARLLQPSVVVIEDVDLIARDRSSMGSVGEEVMLNKLLNEMDGLKPGADVLFILTTNRPEALEAALASRPGRVDQAIEFPLPDAAGRATLVRLYGGGAGLSDAVVDAVVGRTDRVSAAFIKELMRRSVQFQLERDDTAGDALTTDDVDNALNEMLFSGGSLNVKLLGGNVGAEADAR